MLFYESAIISTQNISYLISEDIEPKLEYFEYNNSASADGGPRSSVRTHGTLR